MGKLKFNLERDKGVKINLEPKKKDLKYHKRVKTLKRVINKNMLEIRFYEKISDWSSATLFVARKDSAGGNG